MCVSGGACVDGCVSGSVSVGVIGMHNMGVCVSVGVPVWMGVSV